MRVIQWPYAIPLFLLGNVSSFVQVINCIIYIMYLFINYIGFSVQTIRCNNTF